MRRHTLTTAILLTTVAMLAAPAAEAQLAAAWMVSAAAHGPGNNGTFWRTDLSLHNPHEYDLPVVVQALPSGRVNNQVPTITTVLYPWETLNLWDVFDQDLLGVDGTGAILVYADLDAGIVCNPAEACDFLVFSRTYTPEEWPGEGEFGQSIPGRSLAQGVDWWTFGYAGGILNDGTWFRTNYGVASWTSEWTTVRVDVQTDAGEVVTTRELSIPPYGHVQRRLPTAVSGGSLVFYLVSGPDDALIYPYASIVNELTGDASFVAAEPSPVGVSVTKGTRPEQRALRVPSPAPDALKLDRSDLPRGGQRK